jgi:hypothetical protein
MIRQKHASALVFQKLVHLITAAEWQTGSVDIPRQSVTSVGERVFIFPICVS